MEYKITIIPTREMPSPTLVAGVVLETYAINCECPSNEPQPPITSLIVDLPKIGNVGDWRVAIANVLRLRFDIACDVTIAESPPAYSAERSTWDRQVRMSNKKSS